MKALNNQQSPKQKTFFNKCHFLILEKKDLELSATIIEATARMFSQYPTFTMILSDHQPHSQLFYNKGNSPLVFTNIHSVLLINISISTVIVVCKNYYENIPSHALVGGGIREKILPSLSLYNLIHRMSSV